MSDPRFDARRASDEDWCERYPDEGHSWVYTSHAGTPRLQTRTCHLCGYVSVQPVKDLIRELVDWVHKLEDEARAWVDRIFPPTTPPPMPFPEPGLQGLLWGERIPNLVVNPIATAPLDPDDMMAVFRRAAEIPASTAREQLETALRERQVLAKDVARLVRENKRLRDGWTLDRERIGAAFDVAPDPSTDLARIAQNHVSSLREQQRLAKADAARREDVTEQTLFTVRHTLIEAGFSDNQAMDAINALGSAGILFRERQAD